MSDPFKDLFDTEGLAVNPLAPSEVRRRGDRLRRRRNVAGVVAGVAAVALVATPIALLAGGGDSSSPSPAPSPTETVTPPSSRITQIPDDFPLAAGFPSQSEYDDPVKGPRHDLADIEHEACGSAVPDAGREDRMVASFTNAEDFRGRWLTTYADGAAAQAALGGMIESWQGCPVEPEREDGYVTHREVRELNAGEESWAILERDTFEGGESPFGATTVLVRLGNAIFIEDRAGHAGYPSGDGSEQIRDVITSAAVVIEKMCIFTKAGCGSQDIPVDFPLDFDRASLTQDGGTFDGPSEDAKGFRDYGVCGEGEGRLFTQPAQDRLAFWYGGLEFNEYRELRSYPTAQDAAAQMAAIDDLVAGCVSREIGGGNILRIHTLEADLGVEDALTVGISYETGVGGSIVQVARVGRAILATGREANYSPANIEAGVAPRSDITTQLILQMCVFSDAGCGAEPAHGLSADSLPTDDDTWFHEAAHWEATSTVEGEDGGTISPCLTRSMFHLGATASFRRDFVLLHDRLASSDDNQLAAVVSEFPDTKTAASAYDTLAGNMNDCEFRLREAGYDRYRMNPSEAVATGALDAHAQRWLGSYGPVAGDEFGDNTYFHEAGIALVGRRVLFVGMVTVGQDYIAEPPMPMEVTLANAAQRLA